MLRTFLMRTADAYGYAMVDAINTLCVFEQMEERDRQLSEHSQFSLNGRRPTGSRVG